MGVFLSRFLSLRPVAMFPAAAARENDLSTYLVHLNTKIFWPMMMILQRLPAHPNWCRACYPSLCHGFHGGTTTDTDFRPSTTIGPGHLCRATPFYTAGYRQRATGEIQTITTRDQPLFFIEWLDYGWKEVYSFVYALVVFGSGLVHFDLLNLRYAYTTAIGTLCFSFSPTSNGTQPDSRCNQLFFSSPGSSVPWYPTCA